LNRNGCCGTTAIRSSHSPSLTVFRSTLVDLIARFHDPTRGRVLVDGVDLKTVKLGEWLDRIAVVPQQPFLFNASIRENIRYGRLDASDADIEAAARLARVHDEVVQRGGYDDSAGERGSKLSGGQAQRVALARALVRNPDVLILDEVTSKLDATTERLVQEALGALPKKMTTFVVAHRLSTVRRAHQILVIDGGKLVERGTHDQLVAKGGVYASLIATQLLGAAEAGQADDGSGKPPNL
jgi:ABC-type multidrug transport system fused ATPase/permease subunit